MSSHFLHIANHIIKNRETKDPKSLLIQWLSLTENAPWARVLDTRDWEHLLSCKTWDQFTAAIELLVPKYTKAWEIVERPGSTEEWLARTHYSVVRREYWDVYGVEIDFSQVAKKKKRMKVHS